jgi:hypothetical protein
MMSIKALQPTGAGISVPAESKAPEGGPGG